MVRRGTNVSGNIFSLFETRFPADLAALFIDSPTRGAFSYADAVRWTDQFANYLTAAGATPGDRIAAQVDKSPEALFLYFACLKAGLVFLPLNTGYEAEEIRYFVDDAAPRLFVTSHTAAKLISSAIGKTSLQTLNADGTGSLIDASAA